MLKLKRRRAAGGAPKKVGAPAKRRATAAGPVDDADDAAIAALEAKLGISGKRGELSKQLKKDGADELAELLDGLDDGGFASDGGSWEDDSDDAANAAPPPKKSSAAAKKAAAAAAEEGADALERKKPVAAKVRAAKKSAGAVVDDADDAAIAALEAKLGISGKKGGLSDQLRKDGADELAELIDGLDDGDAPQRDDDDDDDSDGDSNGDDDDMDDDDDDDGAPPVPEDAAVEGAVYMPKEDIYGRASGKWVPPSMRRREAAKLGGDGAAAADAAGGSDKALVAVITAAVNRLSDTTVEACAAAVVGAYDSFPANDVNELVLAACLGACVTSSPTASTAETLAPAYAALVAAVHFGSDRELGCAALERVADLVRNAAHGPNAAALLGRLCDAGLVSPAVAFSFCEAAVRGAAKLEDAGMAVDLANHVVRAARDRLRGADRDRLAALPRLLPAPAAQQALRASHGQQVLRDLCAKGGSRAAKQTTAEASRLERSRKLRAAVKRVAEKFKPGRAHEALAVEWRDLEDADQKGRWWRSGARWSGRETTAAVAEEAPGAAVSASRKLDELAQRSMNTPGRRAAFVALMSSNDAADAAWRCTQLVRLGEADEADAATVAIYCCGAEKAYNAFYAAFLQAHFAGRRKAAFALKLALWDALTKAAAAAAPEAWRAGANVGKLVGAALASGAATFSAFKPVTVEAVLSPVAVGSAVLLASAFRALLDANEVDFESCIYRAKSEAIPADTRDALVAFVSSKLTPPARADQRQFLQRKSKLHKALLADAD